MRRLVIAALACSLAACVPDNLQTLETSGTSVQLSSPLPWQDAYRRLNAQMRQCVDLGGMVTGGVDGQLYDGYGEIVLRYQAGPLTSKAGPILQLRVEPAGAGSSVRATHANHVLANAVAPRVAKWLDGETDCRP